MTALKAIQTIKTDGEELVVLPRSTYDALIKRARMTTIDEDAGTARIIARSTADLRAGRTSEIPGEVVHRIARGENALRVIREWRGMTQTELGETYTDVGQSEVSALEAGRRKGTAATWKKLAKALKVPMDILVPE